MEQWQAIDGADSEGARRLLRACCGSERWVERMMHSRPFASRETALAAARDVWLSLDETDWREAFSRHPRIGDRDALQRRFPESHQLSAREQAGVDGAHEDVLGELASRNREYEARFGYIFIVCASGRSRFSTADKSNTGILSSDQPWDRATLNNSCLVSESVM